MDMETLGIALFLAGITGMALCMIGLMITIAGWLGGVIMICVIAMITGAVMMAFD